VSQIAAVEAWQSVSLSSLCSTHDKPPVSARSYGIKWVQTSEDAHISSYAGPKKAAKDARGSVNTLFANKSGPTHTNKVGLRCPSQRLPFVWINLSPLQVHELLFPVDHEPIPRNLRARRRNGRLGIAIGEFSHTGKREGQEDRVAVAENVKGDESIVFAAVFDGHGGDAVAQYLQQHLLDRIVSAISAERQYVRNVIKCAETKQLPASTLLAQQGQAARQARLQQEAAIAAPHSIVKAPRAHRMECQYGYGEPDFRRLLTYVFRQIDAELLKSADKLDTRTTGACAAVMLMYGDGLIIANVGDCEAWLCRTGRPYELTCPHKADRDSEARRIKQTGGIVSIWRGQPRVAGVLQVSRSVGMGDLKSVYTGIIPDPFVRVTQLRLPVGTKIPPAPNTAADVAAFERERSRSRDASYQDLQQLAASEGPAVGVKSRPPLTRETSNTLSKFQPPVSMMADYANNSEADFPTIGRAGRRKVKKIGIDDVLHGIKPLPSPLKDDRASAFDAFKSVHDTGRPPLPFPRGPSKAGDLSRMALGRAHAAAHPDVAAPSPMARNDSVASIATDASEIDDGASISGFDIDDVSDDESEVDFIDDENAMRTSVEALSVKSSGPGSEHRVSADPDKQSLARPPSETRMRAGSDAASRTSDKVRT
jgi:serine/threonine protein phosphatase PrpC